MSMPWLAAAAEHRALWDDFVAELTNALGDLDDHTVVVVDVGTLSSDGSTWVPGRYLQYAVHQVDGDRAMIAEASGPERLPDAVPQSDELSAAFSQKGWPLNRELLNHARVFVWPEQIGDAVQDSLDIVRDLWRTPSPTAVTIDKRRLAELLGDGSVTGQSGAGGGDLIFWPLSRGEALARISQWASAELGALVEPGLDDQGITESLVMSVRGRTLLVIGYPQSPLVRIEVQASDNPDVIARATPDFLRGLFDSGAGAGAVWVSDGYLRLGLTLAVDAMTREGMVSQIVALLLAADELEEMLSE